MPSFHRNLSIKRPIDSCFILHIPLQFHRNFLSFDLNFLIYTAFSSSFGTYQIFDIFFHSDVCWKWSVKITSKRQIDWNVKMKLWNGNVKYLMMNFSYWNLHKITIQKIPTNFYGKMLIYNGNFSWFKW